MQFRLVPLPRNQLGWVVGVIEMWNGPPCFQETLPWMRSTEFIVNSLSDIVFDGLSIRKIWKKLFLKDGQFGFIQFALDQLIAGNFYGVCGRSQCLKCGNGEHCLCKLNAVPSMKCFDFSFNSNLLANLVFRLANLVGSLKGNQIRYITFLNVLWR